MNNWNCIPILLLFVFVLSLYLYLRKAYAIRKVCDMTVQDKLLRINQAVAPFGFEYKLSQDIFTSRIDAWQKECGYCSLYDQNAPFFHMIFDCEPIYFDYDNATWLVEFWKGQYGITVGCEIGIYKADRIIPENERKKTLFHSVPETMLPVFSITFLKNAFPISRMCAAHWWLTSFSPGHYTEPENLTMKIAVTFSSEAMCKAFLSGLKEAGYRSPNLYISGSSVAFTFSGPHSPQPFLRRSLYGRWIQKKNRLLVRLFLQATKPFCFTTDRLLLLYEYLPFLFRHLLKLRRVGKSRRTRHEY